MVSIQQQIIEEQDKTDYAFRSIILSLISTFASMAAIYFIDDRTAIKVVFFMLIGSFIIFLVSFIGYIRLSRELSRLDTINRRRQAKEYLDNQTF